MIIWDKKFFTAFGYKIIRTNYKAGETLNDLAPQNRQWYNLFTRGGFTNCRTDADSTPPNHTTENTSAGMFYTPTRFQEFHGSLTADVPTDTTIWCLCQEHIYETLPDTIDKWHLANGSTETLTVGIRTAKPSSFPSSSGITNPTFFAAPVFVGIIDKVAALALLISV